METALDGEAGWRGENGPLHISRGKQENPLHSAFMAATEQAGYRLTPDYNGHRQEGFGPADTAVHKGRRWSTADAYLRPALKRGNLRQFTRMLADKILFDGKRAIGVKTYHKGQIKILYARFRFCRITRSSGKLINLQFWPALPILPMTANRHKFSIVLACI